MSFLHYVLARDTRPKRLSLIFCKPDFMRSSLVVEAENYAVYASNFNEGDGLVDPFKWPNLGYKCFKAQHPVLDQPQDFGKIDLRTRRAVA